MLRTVLASVLAFSAASACKGKADAPAVQPGVTAGTVVELSGAVSATRGGATRALATGQEVSGDDIIETSADARVAIVLAHNNARWDLGPGRKEKVGDSLAWKQPKQEGPAKTVDEATLAAGRHAERETVTTNSTATTDKAPPTPEAPAAPGGAPPPPPSATPQAAAPPADQPTPPAQTGPSGGGPSVGGGGGGGGGPSGGEGDATRVRATPPAKPLAAVDPKDSRGENRAPKGTRAGAVPDRAAQSDDLADDGVTRATETGLEKGAKSGQPPKTVGIDPVPEVRERLDAHRAALVACLASDRLALHVVVVKGKATFTFPAGTPDKVKTCVAAVGRKLAIPVSYDVTLDYVVAK